MTTAKKPEKFFNYVIAHRDEEGRLETYVYGREPFYGTMETANNFLTYVKTKSPDRAWKIFTLIELPQ